MNPPPSEWADSVDEVVIDAEPGDRVVFEYETRQGSTSRKTGTVEQVDRGYRGRLRVDVDGTDTTWRLGNSVSVEVRGGRQRHRHLGFVERVRVES